MARRLLILPVIVVAVAALACLTVPTVKQWLALPSVVDAQRLRVGMTAGEVRVALGDPTVRQFGSWVYGEPGELADTGVAVYFDQDHRVCGWSDLTTGENVGGMGEVRPASHPEGRAQSDTDETLRGRGVSGGCVGRVRAFAPPASFPLKPCRLPQENVA